MLKHGQNRGDHGLEPVTENLSPAQPVEQHLCLHVRGEWNEGYGSGRDHLLGIWRELSSPPGSAGGGSPCFGPKPNRAIPFDLPAGSILRAERWIEPLPP